MTAVALLPPLAILVYSDRNLTQMRQVEVHEEALRNVKLAGSELDRILNGLENLLLALVNSPFVAGKDETACRDYIARLHAKVPHLKAIGVADTNGLAWCGTGAGLSLADRSYFKAALAKPDTIFLGQYSVGRASKAQVLPFGLRLANADAVGYGSLDLQWLSEQLRARSLPPGGSMTVADSGGTIVARQPQPERFVGTKIPDRFMRLVNAGIPGTETVVSQDGIVRVLGYIPVNSPPVGLYLSVGLSHDASYGNIERLARIAALVAVSGAFIALVLAWLVGDRMVVRPLSVLASTTAKWRQGDNTARTRLKQNSEFGIVSTDLDLMMDELQRHEQQREILTRELEHRVKNLLATVQAIAQLSFGSSARPELNIFSSRLRALGQGYSAIRADRWEEAELSTVVDRALEPLGGRANDRLAINGPALNLSSGQVLALSMVLHELGTNAVKYGALSVPSGKIEISWTVEDAHVRFTWREADGIAVSAPTKQGFGTRLINTFGAELGHIDLTYPASGVVCVLTFPIAASPSPPLS